jgi:uncharacterized protein (TIGR03086 family)
MDDPRPLHRQAGEMAADVISKIPAERLGDPTPCTEWDVRAVINHMAGGNLRIAGLVTGGPRPDRGEDVLGDDPLAAFRDSLDRVSAALGREGMLEETFATPFGEGPGAQLVMVRTCDLMIHTWDLAAATGQPRDLEPRLFALAEKALRGAPLPRGEHSMFGLEQPAPDGATPADRLAAYFGRKVPAPRA